MLRERLEPSRKRRAREQGQNSLTNFLPPVPFRSREMRQKCLSTNMEAVEELDVDVEGGSVAGMAEAPPGG